ncbi:nuclear transport factor 2 family protein [Leifsonia sp. NPDC058230]|uniref:nuclear transport factor 2 family protein n=1 Tax=Leifsonia sp. NPDC058230 TaxID=3346391 RepID=UPI0036DAD27D
MSRERDLQMLLALEREGWDTLCVGTGAVFYGAIMTEDAVMVIAGGTVLDRQTVLDSLKTAPTWDTFTIEHPTLVRVAPDAAAIVYRARAQRNGDPEFVATMSSVYRHDDSGWRLALYQQTPVTQ